MLEVLEILFDLFLHRLGELRNRLAEHPGGRRELEAHAHLGLVRAKATETHHTSVLRAIDAAPRDAALRVTLGDFRIPLFLDAEDARDPMVPVSAQWADFLDVAHELGEAGEV